MSRCYVCGATEALKETAPHNWACGEHLAAADHVVRMTNDAKDSIATCRCGWESHAPFTQRAAQEWDIKQHWQQVCAQARREAAK